jgi:pimeloyl-ACP methyl ester carboxylesterase
MVTATAYTQKTASVGGLSLSYQEWGEPSAPTVLMLHGFGVSGHMFDEFAERAARRFHLLALDQRGHGDSEWSDEGDYSRDAFVGDVERFREAMGLESFILMGHSMGGMNAVTYASRFPNRVRALILVDVGPESSREGVENIVRFTRGPDLLEFDEFVEMAHRFNPRRSIENIRERMGHRLKQTDSGKWTWKFDKRFREKDAPLRIGSEMSNDEMWKLFRSVATPTLLVRGAESDVLAQDVAERVVREMPNARMALVAGAGHSVPGDNPDVFTESVLSFLADLDRGSFQPEAVLEPLPLEDLVDAQNSHRRPSAATALVAVAAAVLAVGGVTFLMRRGRKRKAERRRVPLPRRAPAVHMPSATDLEATRERMAVLAADLAAMGRHRAADAIHAIRETDLAPARRRAGAVSSALGRRATAVPEFARTVDRKKLRKRSRRAAGLSRAGALLVGQLMLKALTSGRKQRKRRKISRWAR